MRKRLLTIHNTCENMALEEFAEQGNDRFYINYVILAGDNLNAK